MNYCRVNRVSIAINRRAVITLDPYIYDAEPRCGKTTPARWLLQDANDLNLAIGVDIFNSK